MTKSCRVVRALVAAILGGCAGGAAPAPDQYADMFGVWSPDGEKIAFVSDRTGDPEIYVARRDGSGMTRLTGVAGRDAHPYWHPDGKRLAFQSPRNGGDVRIFLMNADGSGQRELAATRGFCGVPTVSPDGERIAFMCSDDTENPGSETAPWRIFLMNADGSSLRRITEGPGNDQVANWSPDGVRLVFWSNRTGRDHVYTLDLATGAIAQLTDGQSENRGAVYSPDGARLYFLSDRGGDGWALYEMPREGGAITKVAAVASEYGIPYLSPDGAQALTVVSTPSGPRIGTLDLATGATTAIEFAD